MSKLPMGQNGLSSRNFHIQRRKFVRQAYPLLKKENAIDLWYGSRILYGKVDTKNVPQLLSETNLKGIPSTPDLMAADFVVDAFEDLRKHINRASRIGAITAQKSFMGLMRPERAWRSANEDYRDHIIKMYQQFVTNFLEDYEEDSKIVNFKSFLESFKKFSRVVGKIAPLTFSGFIRSGMSSHSCSGLIIEIDRFAYDNDETKFDRFYQSNHFNFYQNAARKYGFKIDYNIPWRLVADVTTPEMQEYMTKYLVENPKVLFRKYYYDVFKVEVYMIKRFLIQFYNSFVSGNPIVRKNISGSSTSPNIKSKIIFRLDQRESELDKKYDSFFWLNYYLDLRESELPKLIDRQSKEKKLMEMAYIMKTLDFDAALKYINRELMILERG